MNTQCTAGAEEIKGVLLTKIMTAAEFARSRKISPQAVTAALRRGKPHDGIFHYEKRGWQWIIQVIDNHVKK